MNRRRVVCLAPLLLALCLSSCERQAGSLDSFAEEWRAAAQQRDYGRLFDMLDTGSRRAIQLQVEQIRGLDSNTQQAVVKQLDREMTSIDDLTGRRLFAVMWQRIIGDASPTLEVESRRSDAGVMTLKVGDRTETFDVRLEGDHWAWRLGPQVFDPPVDAPATAKMPAQ